MAGRHFQPPPWRSILATGQPAAAKETRLRRPRHHLHRRRPKLSPFLGLGVLKREAELGAPYSRPTGHSPVLPDVRVAARDGGNSPTAGVLPASSHLLAPLPLRLLAGGGSKPSTACRRSTPGSSSPPVYGPDPDPRPQLCGPDAAAAARRRPKPSPFLGLGVLKREAELGAPYSRPTRRSPVLPDVRVAARDGGNSPAAGVLLPASSHRPYPLPLRLLAAGGSEPSPTTCRGSTPGSSSPPVWPDPRPQLCGPIDAAASGGTPPSRCCASSAPATPPRSSSAGVRPPVYVTDRGDLAGGGRPPYPAGHRFALATLPGTGASPYHATGLRQVLPACSSVCAPAMLQSRRLFCVIPPAAPPSTDLLAVKGQPSSHIQKVIEDIRTTVSESMKTFSAAEITKMIEDEEIVRKSYQDKEELKRIYYSKVRPALLARGLISPHRLSDKKGKQLHEDYTTLLGVREVKYLTSYDLMISLTDMTESYWARFLDFLSLHRCIIIEDWDNSLEATIGTTIYDSSVLFDGSPVYRGESDASFIRDIKKSKFDKGSKGKASLSAAIWNSDSRLLSCVLVKEYPCENSNMAEVAAMLVLLNEGIKLLIQKYPFQPCTDSSLVYSTMWGTQKEEGGEKGKLLRLLEFMRSYYKSLIPRLEPREKLLFVDGLMRIHRDAPNEEAINSMSFLTSMTSYLSGDPIFNFTQKGSSISNAAKGDKSPLDEEQACFVEVEEQSKADAVWHVISALRPTRALVLMEDTECRLKDKNRLLDFYRVDREFGIQTVKCSSKIITLGVKHHTSKTPERVLYIMFDASIPKPKFHKDAFVVFLKTPSEVADKPCNLPEFSPISYVSFRKGHLKKERSLHPLTKWAQKSGKVVLMIELPGAKGVKIDLKPDGDFHFYAERATGDDESFELRLKLYDAVNVEESKRAISPKAICCLIQKADESKFWPRLLKEKGNPPLFLKLNSKLILKNVYDDILHMVNSANKDEGESKVHGGPIVAAEEGQA